MTTDLAPVIDDDLDEAFEERAAVLEFDAGMPRDLAEDCARYDATAPVYADLSDDELLAILARPYPRLVLQRERDEVQRINRFLEEHPATGNDEFINWLLVMPYVEPTVHEHAPLDFPEGWQVDPEWWARVVALDLY